MNLERDPYTLERIRESVAAIAESVGVIDEIDTRVDALEQVAGIEAGTIPDQAVTDVVENEWRG